MANEGLLPSPEEEEKRKTVIVELKKVPHLGLYYIYSIIINSLSIEKD